MVALIGAGVVHADSVVYTLTGTTNPAFGPVHAEGFQYTAPDFITSGISLPASELDSCVACMGLEFFPNGTASIMIPVDFIRFTDANDIIYGFFFAPGDFSAPGTYTSSDFPPYITSNLGTLAVQVTPEPVQVAPEPSSLLLLAAGILGLVGAAHIKKSSLLS
jgi:hypothetical protein